VYHLAEPALRQLVHRCLAQAWEASGDAGRAAFHAAQGGDGPDPAVAMALEASGREAQAKGAQLAAARAFERAARHVAEPDAQAQFLFHAATALMQAGRVGEAVEVITRAGPLAPSGPLRLDLDALHGRALWWTGEIAAARKVLIEGAGAARPIDGERAALLLCDAAVLSIMSGDIAHAVGTAGDALDLSRDASPVVRAKAAYTYGTMAILDGRGDRGYQLVRTALPVIEHLIDQNPTNVWIPAGYVACWMEDFEAARRLLDRAVAAARERSMLTAMPFALTCRAELHLRHGELLTARALAAEAAALGPDVGHTPGEKL
jgi:tetratricopeptide (TPR) repeat protein